MIILVYFLHYRYQVSVHALNFLRQTRIQRNQILDYELTVYICEGTEEEKLEWFKIINIARETLTPQELLNATYTGTWLADAKNYFSKRNCVAGLMADGYIKGNPIRQSCIDYDECEWGDVESEFGVTEQMKELALYSGEPKAYLYADAEGERLPICGGSWSDGAYAGVFNLHLFYPRSYADSSIGFRSAFYGKLDSEI